jgi:hypothetical protein
MYDLILEISHAIMRNGLSLSALGTAIFVLLKQKKVKRKLKKLIPMLFDEDSEVKEYVNNQIKIMENQRLMMEHLGVKGCAGSNVSLINTGKRSLTSSWAGRLFVRPADAFTARELTTYSKRRKNKMLKKIGSSKLQMILVPTIINLCLLVGYMLNVSDIQARVESWTPLINLGVQAVLGIAYAIIEGGIDKASVNTNGVTAYDAKSLDSVRSDSEDVGHTTGN